MNKKFAWIATFVVVLTLVLPWAAFADQVVNNIDNTVDDAAEVTSVAANAGKVVGFYVRP